MIQEYESLWNKITTFPLDEQNAANPFSKKLASEQNWSASFTKSAIEEYRRFMLLCCISPTGAAPSKTVDEVWHLHLTYTKNYWQQFCNNTLGKEIHHNPSKGGNEENHKHNDWYAETLKLYAEVFNQQPPVDIWPQPPSQVTVLLEKYETEKPSFDSKTKYQVAAILIASFILSALMYGKPFPFQLNGQDFLVFYALLVLATIIAMYLLLAKRKAQLIAFVNDLYPRRYSIYQGIYFLYGKHRAVQAAIIDLLKKDILETNDNNLFVNKAASSQATNIQNPLFEALLQRHEGEAMSYEIIVNELYNEQLFEHDRFFVLKMIKDAGSHWQQWLYGFTFVVGLARIFQGLMNDRPILYLIFEILGFSFVYWVVYAMNKDGEIIFKESESRFLEEDITGTNMQANDEVLRDFSQQGVYALNGFSEYAMLATVFGAYSLTSKRFGEGNLIVTSTGSSCSGGGSSCGGDGGGSSCGGGCGGCGGGGD